MRHTKLERDNELLVLTLARGKANAINREVVEELSAAIAGASADGTVRGLVLASDRPKFFSTGFDVAEVFQYDRQAVTELIVRFVELIETWLRFPKPTVAAVGGHAYAGGAALALACDFRVMAGGEFGFALNAINLGIVLPPLLVRLVIDAVGAGYAREMLLAGKSLTPEQALQIGLVSDVAPPEEVRARAIVRARGLAEKPAGAYRALKRVMCEVTSPAAPEGDPRALEEFLDQWFSPEAEQRKRELLESMRR